jgi:AraC-like DNA-binding protein
MAIVNVPEIFIDDELPLPQLFVCDYRMNADVVKNKVNLSLNMFSFLQTGQKQVYFANTVVAVNQSQSLLVESGNCLFTELLNNDNTYYCKLFFFSHQKVADFLLKHTANTHKDTTVYNKKLPYFVIENDSYIQSFVQSLAAIAIVKPENTESFLAVKFDEIMLYLLNKYENKFLLYAHSLILNDRQSSFKKIIEANKYSNLQIEELAFLCNKSVSTFKRHFISVYNLPPGKWFQQQKLVKAKQLLTEGKHTASQLYTDFGYTSLSNFSAAFKKEFGLNPTDVT